MTSEWCYRLCILSAKGRLPAAADVLCVPNDTAFGVVVQMEKLQEIVKGQGVPLELLPELTDASAVQKVQHANCYPRCVEFI